LTLSGPISDATTAAGVNFAGNFNAGTGTGVLTLSGANTYTGPTTVTNGVLEAAKLANHGVASSLGATADVSPANLVLSNATLRYIGTAAASTDRGFTVQGNSAVQFAGNAAINGQISGDASSTLTVAGPGSLTLGYAGTSNLGNLQVVNGALTVGTNAKVQIAAGKVGCDQSSGDLTIASGGELVSSDRFDIGFAGNAHVVLSGTSTTSPAKLTIGGTAWIGFNDDFRNPSSIPSTALVELSGTAEMRIAAAGTLYDYPNVHIGLGTDTTGTITMTDDSKLICEIVVRPDDGAGWLDMGDLGGTANVTLSGRASFSVPNSHAAFGSSTGGKGHLTLNDSAAFTSAKYVYVGVADAAEASITLNGGTFSAPSLVTSGPGVINFNGGALRATAASEDFLSGESFTVNVDAGGAKIDTGGFDITVNRSFTNVSAATPGGLTKLGDGVLTLTAALTEIGDTTVDRGTLNAAGGIDTPSATVYVASGAALTAPSIVADTLTIGGPQTGAAAVPEPGTLALLILAFLAGTAFVRRNIR
jgi:fibronectin-binding autotransporter adhesin